MKVNISAEENCDCFCFDQQIQGSLPKGSVIKNLRLVTFKKDTLYERLCLLIDFDFDYPIETDISPNRTMIVVLKYSEGFKGNLISSCARMGDMEESTDPKVDVAIEFGAVVDGVRFEKLGFGKHGKEVEQECLIIDYHYSTLIKSMVIVLKPTDYNAMLVNTFDRVYLKLK